MDSKPSKPTRAGSNPAERAKKYYPPRGLSLAERFWRQVDLSAGPDDCCPFMGARLRNGYGQFRVGAATAIASRVAWWLFSGASGLPGTAVHIRHTCDNPPCCNPRHLIPGTAADNHRDMVERGRSLAGERNHRAKLTAETAAEIRRRVCAGESCTALAVEFGVDRSRVYQIAVGRGWAHLGKINVAISLALSDEAVSP